jgi:peptide/nickel transport system substrate-binding protein
MLYKFLRSYLLPFRLLFLASLSGSLLGCQSSTPKNVLIYGVGGDVVSLEPGNAMDGNSLIVHMQIYDRLLKFKPGTTEIAPSLAESWTVNKLGNVWTFKLRQGIKFHDGTPFDSQAVAFNVNRWWDPKAPQRYRKSGLNYEIWPQLLGGFKGDPKSIVTEIKVLDVQTIQFVLKQPFAMFPNVIASAYFGIASPAAIQKAGANYGSPGVPAVGTGAFLFKEWRADNIIVLTKNASYWQPSFPKSDGLIIRCVKNPSARLAQLRSGQLDFTVDFSPDQKGELESDKNIQTLKRPAFNVGYIALNPTYKPLADVRVRKAIAYALNRSAIVKRFWKDLGQTNEFFTPPIVTPWGHQYKILGYTYDPKKAKQLLTEAGYGKGFDLDFWYMPVPRQSFPAPKAIAEAMAVDLGKVGIRTTLKTQGWATYLAGRNKVPGYQAFMFGWNGDYGDADNFFYSQFGPGGTRDIGNWHNQQLWQLLDQARATPDATKRNQIYAEADTIIRAAALRIPIVHSQALLAQRRSLQGWSPSPLGVESFAAISK